MSWIGNCSVLKIRCIVLVEEEGEELSSCGADISAEILTELNVKID